MSSDVYFELLRAGESFVTGCADIGFFASMSPHMNDQLATLYECFGADTTTVRSFPCVDPHMSMQFSRMLKRSIADSAFVWAFLSMNSPMDGEILFNRE